MKEENIKMKQLSKKLKDVESDDDFQSYPLLAEPYFVFTFLNTNLTNLFAPGWKLRDTLPI